MVISYQWLLEYLPHPLPVDELSKILTSIGLEVEAVERVEVVKGGLEGLWIGKVLTCGKHPNADKLKVTTVSIGPGEPLHIVCGAPNVEAGQKVVVAVVGTTVHPTHGEPFLIKKAKIRGEDSEGMICAEDEIGLGESHAGIIILPADAVIGVAAAAYFNTPATDYAIHIGLTPNRSDAMSHIGVAKDVCAYLTHHKGEKYSIVYSANDIQSNETQSPIAVSIDAPAACPRYMGIIISGVTITASPAWLQQRLNAIGVRSINNVVDITNYVLHEYGQPLHAFDGDTIKGHAIHVRLLPEGSKFIGLDDKERTLQANDIMICDAEEPIAMGGVFGGLHSGVSQTTTNIFLESAYFTPSYIRKTSLHHGLRTDAATHFEKGVDINNLEPALKRAASLIVEIAGGKIASDVVDVYPVPVVPVSIQVTYSYIQKLSGKHYTHHAIKDLLAALGFVMEAENEAGLTVRVPSNKTDVLQPADIVEEILRIDGLDNIAIPEKLNITLTKALPHDRAQRNKVAGQLTGLGFREIVTNSIVNSKYYPEQTDLVRMLNSLSADLDVMRPTLLESGLEVIQYNCNRKSQDLCLYEFGRVYSQTEGKYHEKEQLGIYVTGNVTGANWKQKDQKADLYYVKSVINYLLLQNGIKNTVVVYESEGSKQISWKWKNTVLIQLNQVGSKRLQDFDIKQDVYFASIDWTLWVRAVSENKIRYQEVPKFPSVQRDLALLLEKQVTYQQVEDVTKQLKLQELQSFHLFDVFESEKLGADKKSYALSYTFQVQDRTLTDVEIEKMMSQLTGVYKSKLQAQIRE